MSLDFEVSTLLLLTLFLLFFDIIEFFCFLSDTNGKP